MYAGPAALFGIIGVLGCSRIPAGRSAIDSVQVLHNRAISAGEIEKRLGTQASPKFLFLFQGVAYDYSVYDESALQRDMSRVERFYQSKGFFDARARVARVRPIERDHVRVEIEIEEGPPAVNRNVTVIGTLDLPKAVAEAVRATARDALAPGARFDEEAFDKAEGTVKQALTDRGYAWASVRAQAQVDVGLHVVDYGFEVVPGPPAVFGPVSFEGLDAIGGGAKAQELPEAALRRTVALRPGAPYSASEIDAARQALFDLQVFSAVDIVPQLSDPPPPDRAVPITIKVEPSRLRQMTFGGGLELDEIKTDLHGLAAWEDHNFLGGLRSFRVTFKPGLVLYPYRINNMAGTLRPLPEEWLGMELRQPGLLEARTAGFVRPQVNVFPLLVEVNPPADAPVVGYQELKLNLGADRTLARRLYASVDYGLQFERPFAYVGGLDPALESVVVSAPEVVLHLDLRDSPVHPHAGVYLGSTFQVAGGILGGQATDVRIQPEVRTYVPLARGLTFATRASVGFLWASNYGSDWFEELRASAKTSAPPPPNAPSAEIQARQAARARLVHDEQLMYFRGFFSGGPSTNRGYPVLGVSPHGVIPFLNPATASTQVSFSCDPAQANFGGDNEQRCFLPAGGFTLWELENELRIGISGPLSGAVFCDMSDVSPEQTHFRFDHLHLSCGIGAAYDTPVGPIRVDVGYRIQPLQVIGFENEVAAAKADPVNGLQPTIFGAPLALAVGIGEAF